MTVKKRKKVGRYRGSQTHGGGAKKKRRGAGNRGGRGKAGTGKRGDAKKPLIWKNKNYFGKHGFKMKNKKPVNSINIKTIEERLTCWANRNIVELKKDIYVVDLKRMGYDKLIGSGKMTRKVSIAVDRATGGAIESVKKAGGNVEVSAKKDIKAKEPSKEEKPEETGGNKE